jgi:L-lysine epsilon oxidase C-terminal domain
MLDRASLEFCLADAFHPGCEMTWPMRTAGLYMAPFRLRHAPAGWIEPDYGPVLGADLINLPNGPLLGGQLPGGVTRWMAVPWQTDTASCRSGYLKSYDPYLPTFWPARVPNQVLTQADYEIVLDPEQPLADRLAAFARRASWLRPLGSNSYTDQINNMIAHFDHMGVVEPRPGPTSGPFPRMVEVEDLHPTAHALAAAVGPRAAEELDLSGIDKMRRFPHGLRGRRD